MPLVSSTIAAPRCLGSDATLRAYLEAGEPADIEFDPPLHVIHDGRGTLTATFEREAYVRFLPLSF